ncbi:MAG: hypothetical protein ACK5AJ_04055 [bacterium]
MISHFQQLAASSIQVKMNDRVETREREHLCALAFYKDQERLRKREYFSKNGFGKTIVITNTSNYGNVSLEIKGEKLVTMSDNELSVLSDNALDCRNKLEGSVVIMTNNNVAKIEPLKMAALVEATPNTVFVVHDFDNHHWHDHSIKCALLADIYAPAHLSDFAIVSRINPVIVPGIPCGTIQWTKQFLVEHLSEMLRGHRKHMPLGMHSYYGKFKFRNSVLATVNKCFDTVGLLKQDFHGRSPLDRWSEWINYPVHWIAPVFNDLPLRFFDSLISGGIPLVPISLKPYLNILGIPEQFYICYTPSDLLSVDEFVRSSIHTFESLGEEARLYRHAYVLRNFHVDELIHKLLSCAKTEYSI